MDDLVTRSGITKLKIHNQKTITFIDEVYETNLKGLKVAKFEGFYFLWCAKWWYGFRSKLALLNFLAIKDIKVFKNEEEENEYRK